MTKDAFDRSGGAANLRAFQGMRRDAKEILEAARRAGEIFSQRPAESFGSLSDLLDEILPVHSVAEARVARAVEMDPQALARLRARELDPAVAPDIEVPLASLGKALGLSREAFLQLASADHARFQGTATLRSWSALAKDPLDGLRAAWERVELDDPARFDD